MRLNEINLKEWGSAGHIVWCIKYLSRLVRCIPGTVAAEGIQGQWINPVIAPDNPTSKWNVIRSIVFLHDNMEVIVASVDILGV